MTFHTLSLEFLKGIVTQVWSSITTNMSVASSRISITNSLCRQTSSYYGCSPVEVGARTCTNFSNDELAIKIIQAEGRQLYSSNNKGTYESVKKTPCASSNDED